MIGNALYKLRLLFLTYLHVSEVAVFASIICYVLCSIRFIRSLARCIKYDAKGGKSRSAFCKVAGRINN